MSLCLHGLMALLIFYCRHGCSTKFPALAVAHQCMWTGKHCRTSSDWCSLRMRGCKSQLTLPWRRCMEVPVISRRRHLHTLLIQALPPQVRPAARICMTCRSIWRCSVHFGMGLYGIVGVQTFANHHLPCRNYLAVICSLLRAMLHHSLRKSLPGQIALGHSQFCMLACHRFAWFGSI